MMMMMMMMRLRSNPSDAVWKAGLLLYRPKKNHHPSILQLPAAAAFSTTTTANKKSPASLPVLTELDTSNGVATITMNNAPVNSLSLEMCRSLSEAVKQAEADTAIQSLVLQSSKSSIFSAGLDLMELHNPDLDRLSDFWTSFQQLYLDLYGSRLACMAAIQGPAPAAGCMLALSCDYRIMAGAGAGAASADSSGSKSKPPTIGLNETKLGIAAPPWLARQFIDTIGRRQAEMGLSLGLLYTPEQALEIGLVDELVATTRDDVPTRAKEAAMEWGRIPPQARVASKMLVRKDAMDHLVATRQEDTDHFVGFVTHPKVQENLTAYLEMLASKRK